MRKSLFSLLLLAIPSLNFAQKPQQPTSSEIFLKLKKLNVLGSVLYMAAHPDDEKTALIAYYANQKLYNTNYLSLTRGDGGQNLVGSELREKLGIIRTQELLQARRIDGGHQYFSTANDFGFSKNPEEVFTKWNKDSLLANAVWIIRTLQPDVMIMRFPKDSRAGHGQHSASSILAEAAFKAAADSSAFPEQLKFVKPWQVKRLVWNTSSWAFGSKEEFNKYANQLLKIHIGDYNPYLGKSIGEIAAESRSMHKSQAFGTAGNRNDLVEYFEPTLGITAKTDLFEDVNTTWSRIPHSDSVAFYITNAIKNYDLSYPDRILPDLLRAKNALQKLSNSYWKTEKLAELNTVIKDVLGLYITATVAQNTVIPGDSITINTELSNRSTTAIRWISVSYNVGKQVDAVNILLDTQNTNINHISSVKIPLDFPYTQHYWLKLPYTDAMYKIDDVHDLDFPENEAAIQEQIQLLIGADTVNYNIPVVYKNVDPVKGELFNPLIVTPPGFVNLDNSAYMFPNGMNKKVTVKVSSVNDPLNGTLSLKLPEGWIAKPATQNVTLSANNEQDFSFDVYPSSKINNGSIVAILNTQVKNLDLSKEVIQYDHIPTQILMEPAQSKAALFSIKIVGKNIGYLMGAGDVVPAGLKQIGYNVTLLQDKDVTFDNLKQYDAIMVGVRAYNTLPKIAHYQEVLLAYAKNGGNVVAQYNVFRGLLTDKIGPFDLHISNERVTDENAPIRFTNPENEALNYPNKITQKDFEGWVQERGLYFPDKWDTHYKTIIAAHDPNEKDLEGGILIAKYGKGYFVYTVYDWFRELPAGVPGAYRLLANLLSLGKK